ncbi:transmembrane sensor [Catalinimonas alkaloidigena]|uniref:FecR family protein n=1 Tax=Catalinimonas alkaloidigena TaxID=1075417 RepID=UPI00240744BF|nr:FecR domain-containing protein [Catalinimonas alkaloidigena]MDF9796342.1 transmembrane sensor [Catalinimonas alkaloidigena]
MDPKKALFQKFIKGECSPEEVEQLLVQIQHQKEDSYYQDIMDEVWAKLESYPSIGEKEKDRQFSVILERSSKARKTKENHPLSKYGVKIAAVFIGFLMISSLLYLLYQQSLAVTYQTGYGETLEITLPDGSEVLMNNNSTLSYDSDWGEAGARVVNLKGEAFFSVVHTLDHQKFTVNTSDEVDIEVLGTRFNVNNRRNTTEVVLNEGKVKVNFKAEQEKQEILMEPGELVAYSSTTQQYQKKLIDTKTRTSWKDKLLTFDSQSLKQIAQILEDNYGYTIQFANEEISTYEFTGTIPTDKVEALFTMLNKAFNLEIEKEGKQIWIKPK